MKLKEWIRKRKERREERRQEKILRRLGPEEYEYEHLDADTEDITPPESRFTEEYREFLKEEEAAKKGKDPTLDER